MTSQRDLDAFIAELFGPVSDEEGDGGMFAGGDDVSDEALVDFTVEAVDMLPASSTSVVLPLSISIPLSTSVVSSVVLPSPSLDVRLQSFSTNMRAPGIVHSGNCIVTTSHTLTCTSVLTTAATSSRFGGAVRTVAGTITNDVLTTGGAPVMSPAVTALIDLTTTSTSPPHSSISSVRRGGVVDQIGRFARGLNGRSQRPVHLAQRTFTSTSIPVADLGVQVTPIRIVPEGILSDILIELQRLRQDVAALKR